MNRDYAILSSRYNDLNNLFFEARADEAVLERGQGERLQVLQPASLPSTPSFPNPLLLVGGGIAMTLFIALAIPFGLFYTDTSFKDSDDVRAEFADTNTIAISRVPDIERHHLNGQLTSAQALLAPPVNGIADDSGATRNGHSANGGQSTADGESANHNGANENSNPPMGPAARFAQRYPAPPLVAAGEAMIGSAADEFQLLAFKLKQWAVQHDAKVFVVASAIGGEGKSFVALNLAAALAVSGERHSLNRRRYPRAISALCLSDAEGARTARISAGSLGIHSDRTADTRARSEPVARGWNQQPRAGIPGFHQNAGVGRDREGQRRLPIHNN